LIREKMYVLEQTHVSMKAEYVLHTVSISTNLIKIVSSEETMLCNANWRLEVVLAAQLTEVILTVDQFNPRLRQ